jgi:TRAP transporter TAXI family solute receptor
MKKFFALLLAMVMALSLVACGNKTPVADETGDPAAVEVSGNFVMGTGGVAGTWYPLGGVMCGAMTKDKLNVTVQSSGGGVENVRTILSGERDLGMVGADVAYYGYSSQYDFEGQDGTKLRSLMAFAPMQTQLIANANAGVNCIADLKGKAVGCGAVGSGDELAMRNLLDIVGLSYDDVDESLVSVAEQSTSFKDRRLDTMYITASAPTSGILDAASAIDCMWVPIAGAEAEAVVAELPFFYPITVSAGTYSFMSEDVDTLGLDTILLCSTDLSDETVYAMLENLFANVDDVIAAHPSMANFSLESACAGEFTVPLHDGAVKFYQDKGVL